LSTTCLKAGTGNVDLQVEQVVPTHILPFIDIAVPAGRTYLNRPGVSW